MTALPIFTPRLILRNWRDGDRKLFHEINSDDEVMAFFPFRRDRAASDELMDRLRRTIEDSGRGFFALEIRGTGECAGFAGLAQAGIEPLFPAQTHEVGWRLARPYWGNGYATEAGLALLDYGFRRFGLDEIVSFAVAGNRRSLAVMGRIGLHRDPTRDFDHPRIPESHPHLRRHLFCAISREEWQARQEEAARR